VVSAVDSAEAQVRELVRLRGLDPVADRTAVRRLVDEVVTEYDERAMTSALSPLPRLPHGRAGGLRRGRRLRPAAKASRRPFGRGDLDQRSAALWSWVATN